MRSIWFGVLLIVLNGWWGATAADAQWRVGSKLSIAAPVASAAVMDGQIYVLSGAAGTGFRKFFEVYDIVGDGWRPLTPMPMERLEFAVAAGKGRVYVTGGRTLKTGALSSEVWAYAPESAVWIRLADLPNPRAQHAALFIDNGLVVLGGQGNKASEILRYDFDTRKWQKIGRMPEVLRHMAVAYDASNIYVAGGTRANGRNTRRVRAFNVQTRQWRSLPDLPRPVSGSALAMLADGLHSVGGYSQSPPAAQATHYVLQSGRWTTRPPLPQARHLMGYGATANALFIIGGALGEGIFALFTASDQIYIFRIGDKS